MPGDQTSSYNLQTLEQLGLPVTPTLRQAIARARERGPNNAHRYSMADWGLNEEDIVTRYGDVMERWGYGGVTTPAGGRPA